MARTHAERQTLQAIIQQHTSMPDELYKMHPAVLIGHVAQVYMHTIKRVNTITRTPVSHLPQQATHMFPYFLLGT